MSQTHSKRHDINISTRNIRLQNTEQQVVNKYIKSAVEIALSTINTRTHCSIALCHIQLTVTATLRMNAPKFTIIPLTTNNA